MQDDLDAFVEKKFKELNNDDKAKEEYAKARAVAEVKETSAIVQDSTKALQTKLNQKVAEHIDTSQAVAERIEKTADKLVDRGLQAQENRAVASVIKSEDETLEADFEKNKQEYLYHGINHKIDKQWKRNLIHIINDIWFVIWAIVSAFTIVPVSTFLSRIAALKGFMKGVALVLGIAMLLAVLGGLTYWLLDLFGVF